MSNDKPNTVLSVDVITVLSVFLPHQQTVVFVVVNLQPRRRQPEDQRLAPPTKTIQCAE